MYIYIVTVAFYFTILLLSYIFILTHKEAFHLVFFFSFSKTEPKISHFLLLLRSTSTLPSQLLFILVAYSFHHEVKM